MKRPNKNLPFVVLGLAFALDAFLWFLLVFSGANAATEYYFLDVGQGDGEMIRMPDNAKLLIDGGPDNSLMGELGKVLPVTDRYIDMMLMTHPQLDHFGGFIETLKNYRVGVFLGTGRAGTTGAYRELMEVIRIKQVPYVTLMEGDRITYKNIVIDVLSPNAKNLASKELNDGCLVLRVADGATTALLTCDAGANIEQELAFKYDLSADILKAGHHGSRFSSSEEFLAMVKPKVSIIEVGKNSYGHPTQDALGRLYEAGSQIFRTDLNGLIKIVRDGDILRVLAEKK